MNMNALIAIEDSKWADELATTINSLGYKWTKCVNSSEIIKTIKAHSVDLIICETVVNQEDTITLFQNTPDVQCPIIFITDAPTELTYRRTTQFRQSRFLVKPFHQLTLRSIVEALTSNVTIAPASTGIRVRSSIGQRVLLTFDKILWISADKNYCLIHTSQNQYVLKQSLTKLSKQLDYHFIQVHKGFWVNLDHITRVNLSHQQLFINDTVIPIGKTYKAQLADRLLTNQTIKL